MKTTKKQAKAPTPPQPMPEWVTNEPVMNYEMQAWEQRHGVTEQIEITKEEYFALKKHLAKLRGFEVKEAA